jgi:RNase P/RNase MRP subunit p29
MMPITESNVHQHELIGLQARVESSRNTSQNIVCGIIVDETMYTITISDGLRDKIIQKKDTSFVLSIQNGYSFVVEGSRLLGKSIERVRNRSGGT